MIAYESAPAKRASRVRDVADNPVLWRELRRPLLNRRWQKSVAIGICLVVLGVVYFLQGYNNALGDTDAQGGYAVVFNFLFSVLVVVIAATAISQEKEGDTWTLMLAAPLSGATIVWGKAMGVLRRLLWPFALIVVHFLTFTVTGVITVPTFLVLLWVIFTFNSIWVATGVYFSLRFSKTTMAVIANLLSAIALYAVLPAILGLASTFSTMDNSKEYIRQICWYEPYYYLIAATERNGRTLDYQGTFQVDFPPTSGRVTFEEFAMIAFVVGCAHLVLSSMFLRLASRRFSRIVGRAPQIVPLILPAREMAIGAGAPYS